MFWQINIFKERVGSKKERLLESDAMLENRKKFNAVLIGTFR